MVWKLDRYSPRPERDWLIDHTYFILSISSVEEQKEMEKELRKEEEKLEAKIKELESILKKDRAGRKEGKK